MRKILPSMPCAMIFFLLFFFKGMGAFLCYIEEHPLCDILGYSEPFNS